MKPPKKYPYFLPKLIVGMLFLLGSVACSPPAGVKHLADIQRAFSETAAKDNQFDKNMLSKTSVQDINAVSLDSVAISTGYASVLDQLAFSDEQRASLQTSGLWGNVLMLKAMTQWRLQKYVDALETRQEIDEKTYATLGHRDQVMYHMVPGLIKNDEFYQQLKQQEGQPHDEAKARNIQQGFSSALTALHAALDKSKGNQQMRRYILISYLGAYKNSQDACDLSEPKYRHACINHKSCEALASYIELEKSLDASDESTRFLQHVRVNWLGMPREETVKKAYEDCKTDSS